MRNFLVSFRRYAIPDLTEAYGLAFTALVGGFIFTFNKWGAVTFDFWAGLSNLVLYSLMLLIVLLAIELGRRFWATKLGYEVEYHMWAIGLLISAFSVFFTRGYLTFLLPGGFTVKEIPHLRIGHYQYRLKVFDLAKIGIAGVVAGVFMTVILSNFVPWGVTVMNMIVLFASLVPLDVLIRIGVDTTPPSAGSTILIGTRIGYIFAVAICFIAFLLLKFAPSWLTIIVSFFAAALVAFAYMWWVDPDGLKP
jgi:hypothetical protein